MAHGYTRSSDVQLGTCKLNDKAPRVSLGGSADVSIATKVITCNITITLYNTNKLIKCLEAVTSSWHDYNRGCVYVVYLGVGPPISFKYLKCGLDCVKSAMYWSSPLHKLMTTTLYYDVIDNPQYM